MYLIFFFQVQEGVTDFRDALDNLGTHDAEEAAVEYQMRVAKKVQQLHRERDRGFGGLVRGGKPPTEDELLAPVKFTPFGMDAKAPGLRPQDTKEEEKPVSKNKGMLFQLQEKFDEEQERKNREKNEQLQEAYARKMKEKAEKSNR